VLPSVRAGSYGRIVTKEPDRKATSTPPDWDLVAFDVGCARCGCDIRGLSEPKCPACGLEFDWSDAVPLEELTCLHCGYHLYGLRDTRCPECGKPFTWEEALAAYHRRKKVVFEYLWREKPVRSLLSTWWLAIRPWKLWRVIDIHDPPQVKPLLVMLVAALATFSMLVPVFIGVADWLALRTWAMYQGGQPVPTVAVVPHLVAATFAQPGVWCSFPIAVLWWAMSFVAFFVFQETLRRCEIRTAQVLRVHVYASVAILPLVPLLLTVVVCASNLVARGGFLHAGVLGCGFPLPVVGVVLFMWSGYKKYLRMPHGLAVAIASQVIALLAVAVVISNIVGL